MKQTLALLLFLACSQTAAAQNGVLHLVLADGSTRSGFLLLLTEDALVLQENTNICDSAWTAPEDTAEAWRGAIPISLSEIRECEIERVSIAFPWIFPGLMVGESAAMLAGEVIDEHTSADMAMDVIGWTLFLSVPLAILVHYLAGYDYTIDVRDPGDLKLLAHFALLQPERSNTPRRVASQRKPAH